MLRANFVLQKCGSNQVHHLVKARNSREREREHGIFCKKHLQSKLGTSGPFGDSQKYGEGLDVQVVRFMIRTLQAASLDISKCATWIDPDIRSAPLSLNSERISSQTFHERPSLEVE